MGWVEHTHEVLANAAHLLALGVDMETGMRGFLLAGKEGFLAPTTTAKRILPLKWPSYNKPCQTIQHK